jgi:hypothetical protein
MQSDRYVNELESRCGKAAEYFNGTDVEGGHKIGLIGFDHYPAKNEYTYFSYGLHSLNKPEWKFGRPEYFVVVNNPDRAFGLYFAHLISAFALEKVMSWNTLLAVGESDAIDGYPYKWIALGMPQYLNWSDYQIQDPGYLSINLGMAYYISNKDCDLAREQGMEFLEEKLKQDPNYWKTIQTSRLG